MDFDAIEEFYAKYEELTGITREIRAILWDAAFLVFIRQKTSDPEEREFIQGFEEYMKDYLDEKYTEEAKNDAL
jgi:hypothetical protein